MKLAILNGKGGVGKTTTTINLGAALAEQGRRVVLLDLDPFAGLSGSFGDAWEGPTIADVLFTRGRVKISDTLRTTSTPGLVVIPSDPRLARVEPDLIDHPGLLADSLAGLDVEDLLIDTPPTLGALAHAALAAAGSALVPVAASGPDLARLPDTIEVLRRARATTIPDLTFRVLVTRTTRTRLSEDVIAELRQTLDTVVLAQTIPQSVRVGEAPRRGRTLLQHDKKGGATNAYRRAAQEILDTPRQTAMNRVSDAVYRYLIEHPDSRHESAHDLACAAIFEKLARREREGQEMFSG